MGVAAVHRTDPPIASRLVGRIKQTCKYKRKGHQSADVLFYSLQLRRGYLCQMLCLKRTDNVRYRLKSVSVQVVVDTLGHLDCNRRIDEVGRTDLDG